MGRWIEYVDYKETENGFDEEFVVNNEIREYEQLSEINFVELVKNSKFKDMTLASYYMFSDIYESENNITIIFDARYDNSSIRVIVDKDEYVQIFWCAGYKYDDKELHDNISYKIEEDIIPELIEKLINL